MERVTEEWVAGPAGERLALSWHGAGEGAPVVVLCHGMEAHRGGKVATLAAALQERGIAVARFDHAGCGASEGSHHPIDLGRRVAELRTVVRRVRERVGTEAALGLGGSSMGAAVTLVGAAELGAAAWAGVATPVRLWPEVGGAADRFRGQALLVWGDEDEVVSPEDSRGLRERWGDRAAVLEIPGGDHRLADHVPAIAGRFAAFFQRALSP